MHIVIRYKLMVKLITLYADTSDTLEDSGERADCFSLQPILHLTTTAEQVAPSGYTSNSLSLEYQQRI